MSRRFSQFGRRLLPLPWLVLSGCSSARSAATAPGATATYDIECMHLGECWAEAQRKCGGAYRALETHENTIPDSDLPGLNAETDAHSYRHDGFYVGGPPRRRPFGPGIESSDPLPLADVVVACVDVPSVR